MYYGWADVVSNPAVNSLAYYQEAMRVMRQANASLALYMIPGMGHCVGGVTGSCDQIDWVTPLVNWLKSGFPLAPLRVRLLTGPEQGRSVDIRPLKSTRVRAT